MSPRSSRARRTWRTLAMLTTTALVLAGCNSGTPAVTRVTGIPSIGISVPLHKVACTTSNSCIAVGTTGSQLAPTSVGEYRRSNGDWSVLNVPDAPSSLITSVSCWKTGCLIGGIEPSGSLLWSYNASSQSVSVQNAPPSSLGVRALDCFSTQSCAAIVSVPSAVATRSPSTNLSAISFTSDGGVSWSSPAPLPWTLNQTVKSASCTNALTCMVSTVGDTGTLDVAVTHDAGLTWVMRTTPSTWSDLTSLHCVHLKCVGIASTATSSLVARTATFGRLWSTSALPVKANALACVTLSTCVVVGQSTSSRPWLASLSDAAYVVHPLRYVPSPLVDVACGTTTCVGNGVSTLVAIRP
ncbi:MAG: hypothetical protein ACYC19_00305 [Acidimicrobiales bacterium]